ncbi:triose-phosphate isomerase [bacterium]|nr:triose-phosphate isomerase [bacterium]
MRKPVFAANWKMNKTIHDAESYCDSLLKLKPDTTVADIVVAPPFTAVNAVATRLKGSGIQTAAQNVSTELSGAFTGEIGLPMLTEAGCSVVIVGHSERRTLFGESPGVISSKLERVISGGLTAIFCIGETLSEREQGTTDNVLKHQLEMSLKPLQALLSDRDRQLIVAYEPVWAIGTGKVATPEQAQLAHHQIRVILGNLLGTDAAKRIRIQYGGSVKPDNTAILMSQPDIDGALVGGASLAPDSFFDIVRIGSVV